MTLRTHSTHIYCLSFWTDVASTILPQASASLFGTLLTSEAFNCSPSSTLHEYYLRRGYRMDSSPRESRINRLRTTVSSWFSKCISAVSSSKIISPVPSVFTFNSHGTRALAACRRSKSSSERERASLNRALQKALLKVSFKPFVLIDMEVSNIFI
jgi:hypothetical protein